HPGLLLPLSQARGRFPGRRPPPQEAAGRSPDGVPVDHLQGQLPDPEGTQPMVRTLDPGALTLRAAAAWPAGDDLPSAIVLGGGATSLSVARSLGRAGVQVYAINEGTAYVRYSRYCRWLAGAGDTPESWIRFLLGPKSNRLGGSVLLACSDDAIAIIAGYRP